MGLVTLNFNIASKGMGGCLMLWLIMGHFHYTWESEIFMDGFTRALEMYILDISPHSTAVGVFMVEE
jgi:hypothetical protein